MFGAILTPALFVHAAGNPVELYFFEGQGCPHCARMKSYLEGLKADYPNLTVKDYEVYFDKAGQDLFRRMAAAYNSNSNGVPMLFVGDTAIIGEDYETLRSAVEYCSTNGCVSPASKLEAAELNSNANINANTNTAANENIDVNKPATTAAPLGKNEIVGWVVIGIFVAAGVGLIIYMLKAKK